MMYFADKVATDRQGGLDKEKGRIHVATSTGYAAWNVHEKIPL